MYKNLALEPSIVLHTRPFKETSLLVDLFTRNHGKISVIAKGAQRPKSKIGTIKTPSCLFFVSCTGRGELKTLTHCEIKEYFFPIAEAFNSVVYLNELLIKLLEKEDPHPEIFDHYLIVCGSLKSNKKEKLEKNLRSFELTLLKEIGYGLNLNFEGNSDIEIKEDTSYKFVPSVGFLPQTKSESNKNNFSGRDILNLSTGNFSSPDTLLASKQIMRQAIDFHLGNKTLKIREYLSQG